MINKNILKQYSIRMPWWIRFLLWFKKPLISCDMAKDKPSYFLMTKRLFGKIYIIKEWEAI